MAREQVGTAPSRPDDPVDIAYLETALQTIPGVDRIWGEIPGGTKDGTNPDFTLAHPFMANTTVVFRNGLREQLNIGYTESAPNGLVFSNPPLSDDDLSVDYTIGQVS